MADTEASPYIDLDGLKRAVSALDRRYSAAGHRHATEDVEGLDAALAGRAPLHHAHYMREVVGLTTALAGKADGSHAHSSLAAEPLEAGADLDALDMSRGDASVRLWSCYGGAAVEGAPDGETGAFALACELLRWADADDFASRQTYVSASGREWQRFCASGEWTAWSKVYTSGDMPTPAEIGAADRVHAHVVADVTGLRAELDGKAASEHGHAISDVDQLQATLDAKAPVVHQHAMADVTGLSSALAGKSDAGHLHAISDVVNLGLELQGKSPVTHGHDAATQTAAGFLSATDKAKLDRVADGATRVTAVSQIANDMGYVNSDQTREQTLEITADMATKTWVDGQDYQSGAEVSEAIASAVSTGTADMATRTWVEQQGYQDASQVNAAVEAGTADMATRTWVSGRGYQTAEQVDAAVEAKGYQTAAQVDSAIAAKGYDTAASVDSKVAAAKTELQSAISQAVASVLKWQGAVATTDDLPATSTVGHVYHVDADGGEYAWDGSQWVELGSVVELTWDAISGKPATFAPSAHTHAQDDVTGLASALAGKSDTGHVHVIAGVTGLQSALDGKSAVGHGHSVSDTTGLQAALDGKAPSAHTHTTAQVDGLSDALAGKAAASHVHQQADVTGLADALAGKAATGHKHSAADVTSGTLPLARGGTGATTAAGALAALGAASAGHSHAVASGTAAGFMSVDDKQKLDGIAAGANAYVHPAYTARAAGLYKVTVDATGHVSGATAVAKADITALGVPAQDTTYGLATTGAAGLLRQLNGSTGQYLRGDGTWATPPNTTYGVATASANGLMSAADKGKLDSIQVEGGEVVVDITVDSALSATSTNPVQNKVVKAALDGKAASSHTHNYAGSSSAGGAATSAAKVNVTTLTSQNLNDYRTPGTFFAAGGGNTCTNKPSGVDNFGMFVIQSAGGWQTQFLYGSNDVTYTRAYHGGTWTSWVEMYTSANKPTASEIGAAAASHTHSIANVSGLQDALNGKAASSHSHAASAITSGTLSADRLPTVPIAKGGTGATSASAARTALGITPANIGAAASSHSHPASQVTGLTASRALVSDSSGHPAVSAVTATELGYLDGVTSNVQTQLNGKASSGHTHTIAQISNLQSTLDGKAASSHTHTTAQVSGLGSAATKTISSMSNARDVVAYVATDGVMEIGHIIDFHTADNDGKDYTVRLTAGTSNITLSKPLDIAGGGTGATSASAARTALGITPANIGAAASSHNHSASNITSGTLSVDRLPTVSVAKGGTGATTAAQARTNLGAAASSHNHSAANITSGTLAVARGGTGVTSDDALRQKVLNFPDNDDLKAYLGLG